MGKDTKIEWCDHTVNLWWGCAKVHTGCTNCYAETLSNRWGNDIWGENNKRKRIKSAFPDLDKYQKLAEANNSYLTIFCGSMMDIFEGSKPLLNPVEFYRSTWALRKALFIMISGGCYNNLIFLFLTKRPENIIKMIPQDWGDGAPKNVWFGTSISDQDTADEYITELRKYCDSNLFLSVEPQIGEINYMNLHGIDWVIQGGESGAKKRPFDIKWAGQVAHICRDHQTPYFFKQIDKVQGIPDELMIRELPDFKY